MPLDRPAGARGAGLRGLAVGCALAWATLHVWFASPLGLLFVELSLNEAEARSVHLAFALLLAGLLGRGSRPVRLALAAAGALTAGYIVARYDELAARPGQIADLEIALGASGLGLLLVAAWQVVGRALAVLCAVALVAMVVGVGSGVDVVLTQWFSTRGVFGAPLGLSSQFLLLAGVFALLLAGSGVAGDWAALIDRLWPGAPPGAGGFAARLLAGLAAPGSAAAARAGAVAVGPARDVAALAVVAALMSQAVPPLLGYVIALVPGTLRIAPASVLGGTAVVGALAIAGIVMVWRGPTAPPPRRIALWLVATGALGAAGFGVVSGFAHAKASYGGAVSWIAAATTLAVGLALQWRELRLAPATTARLAVAALRGALPLLMLVWGIVVEGLDPALVVFWAIGFMIFALLTRALLEPARHRHGSLLSLAQALRAVARGVVRGVESAVPVAIAAAAAGLLIAAAAALD
ncbi:MAG: hypothetical protein HY060_09565, partial [Proteobacteria bacterium]|nr:hypothetical protein [Pseudomonadota bacterium]